MNKIFICVISIFLFISCDPSGNVFITNNYPHPVKVTIFYDNNGIINQTVFKLKTGITYAPAAIGHTERKNITKIVVEDNLNMIMSIYTANEINQIKSKIIKKGNTTSYHRSENGLVIYWFKSIYL